MKTLSVLCAIVALSAVAGHGQVAPARTAAQPPVHATPPSGPNAGALINQYCAGCHSSRLKTGGIVLEGLDVAKVDENSKTLERVVRMLRSGMMPPQGSRRPDAATYEALTVGLETNLDRAAAARPHVLAPGLHRVNRTEYANAVHDLIGIEIDPAAYLPVDDSSGGFDNVADSLNISPALVEGFVSAAAKISRLAMGHDTAPSQKKYIAPQDYSQEGHVEGLPLGTRGGMLIRHYFSADGEYVIAWFPVRGNTGELYGSERKGEELEVSIDGERVKVFDIEKIPQGTDNDKNEVRVHVKAGMHNVGLAFPATTQVPMDDLNRHNLRSVLDTNPIPGYIFSPQVGQVIISGPYEGKRPETTASREKILICQPKTAAEETPCARKVVSNLARRAYRRPIAVTEVNGLVALYQKGRKSGTFEDGIVLTLQSILADPEFIFRGETDPVNVKAGDIYRISDLELASRLSFFLWSSPPDDELLRVAGAGQLRTPRILEQQTRRLLADSRSRELVKNFGGQWLQLRNLQSVAPVTQLFPDFDDNLRQAFRTETEMFFESIVREDRNVNDLLTANYTFVNERLARHYGIPGVYGSRFRRVTLAPEMDARRGLLGKGSIQLVTSVSDRTSPVQRGKWVLMNLLGVVPPDPPPNVPALKMSDKQANGQAVALEQSMRDRMIEHRVNPACAACHAKMDPIGFALENFDAVGKWRSQEWNRPIDGTGQLADGTRFDGPSSLRQALLHYSPQFVRTMTEKMLTYALGRRVDEDDMPTVRGIVRDADRVNDRFSSLVLGIVKSAPFQMNRKAS